MVLPEADPKEYEQVRNILTLEGLWQTFNGDEYDAWVVKVINVLKLQDLWHFIAEEDLIDPESCGLMSHTRQYRLFSFSLHCRSRYSKEIMV